MAGEESKDVVWIIFLSVIGVIWWASIWGIFQGTLEALVGHKKNLQFMYNIMIAIVIGYVYYQNPQMLKSL